jgi:hypothetical protein
LQSEDAALAFVYFNHKFDNLTPTIALGNILKQLAQQKRVVFNRINPRFQRHQALDTRPTLKELSEVLRVDCASIQKIVVVLDALDECPVVGGSRSKILDVLHKCPNVQLMITGRHNVGNTVTLLGRDVTNIEIRARDEDMSKYVNEELFKGDNFRPCLDAKPGFDVEIADKIVLKADGMYNFISQRRTNSRFLLAHLHLEYVSQHLTVDGIRRALDTLPTTLDAWYATAVDRISKIDVAMRGLKWITHSQERLRVAALQHALAVTEKSTDLDETEILPPNSLVSMFGGLATIDKESDTIRLVHYTTQTFLEKLLPQSFADVEIADTCLKYLAFDPFAKPFDHVDGLKKGLEKYGLLEYAIRYWAHHVLPSETTYHDTLLNLFGKHSRRDAQVQLWFYLSWTYHYNRDVQAFIPNPDVSLLHIVAIYGLPVLCGLLLNTSPNLKWS